MVQKQLTTFLMTETIYFEVQFSFKVEMRWCPGWGHNAKPFRLELIIVNFL